MKDKARIVLSSLKGKKLNQSNIDTLEKYLNKNIFTLIQLKPQNAHMILNNLVQIMNFPKDKFTKMLPIIFDLAKDNESKHLTIFPPWT